MAIADMMIASFEEVHMSKIAAKLSHLLAFASFTMLMAAQWHSPLHHLEHDHSHVHHSDEVHHHGCGVSHSHAGGHTHHHHGEICHTHDGHSHHHHHSDSKKSDGPSGHSHDCPSHPQGDCPVCDFVATALAICETPVTLIGSEQVSFHSDGAVSLVIERTHIGPFVRGPPAELSC